MFGRREQLANRMATDNGRIRRTILSVVPAIAIGWILCEGLLRILIPQPIYYSTWFTAGVHQHDDRLGFVFRPNYNGAMRNADQVWMEPLRLDADGFRLPAVRMGRSESGRPLTIVMLGGASMAFCYGLPDADCLHQQVADRLNRNCRIELVSWPGFTIDQDIQKLKRFTNPRQFDIAVLYGYDADDFESAPNGNQVPPTVGDQTTSIRMIDSVVVPPDPAARLAPSLYYRSYLIAGLCRMLRVPAQVFSRLLEDRSDAATTTRSIDTAFDGDLRLITAAQRLRSLGIKEVLIVALPREGRRLGPPHLPPVPSRDLRAIDLRDEFDQGGFHADWIASGHYGPGAAGKLAGKIATALTEVD